MAAQPLISIIVPVHGVRDYLAQCLDSILGQSGPDVEVVAVDDASPDGCGRILDARAARDARLRVLHRDVSGGPGVARNAGLALATGDYVWFADADDQVADGSLTVIAARLSETRPDVLLIGWEHLLGDGRAEPNRGRWLLPGVPAGGCTLAEMPTLINASMTGWCKVFRRDFLAGLGVGFGAGIHEDVLLSATALLRAKRIAALDRVCYRYRSTRRGSFMRTTSDAHFAIFDAYHGVLARPELASAPPDLRAAVFARAIWHYTTIFGTRPRAGLLPGRGVIPRARRAEYFARMHEDYRAYRPAGFRRPAGVRGAKFRLIERGAYRTYRLLEPGNRARVALAGRVRSVIRPG